MNWFLYDNGLRLERVKRFHELKSLCHMTTVNFRDLFWTQVWFWKKSEILTKTYWNIFPFKRYFPNKSPEEDKFSIFRKKT